MLREAGHIYRSEGAVWLRTTTFGDDKDRVVTRSNGEPTYLAADVAYLENKRERGFERQLLPVGADHHAYVRELKAAMAALGADPDTLEVPLLQFVHLVEGDDRRAFSKRRGDFVTLDDLLDEIGVDVTRYFMLQRSHDRTLDLDLDVARQQSAENPVYYIQYAHARIASMLGRLDERRVQARAEHERLGRGAAASLRAKLDQEADRAAGRDRGGCRTTGAAPNCRLRARARAGVHGVLPRLQGPRRHARAVGVLPDRTVRRGAADDCAIAGAARGECPRLDVAAGQGRRRRPRSSWGGSEHYLQV